MRRTVARRPLAAVLAVLAVLGCDRSSARNAPAPRTVQASGDPSTAPPPSTPNVVAMSDDAGVATPPAQVEVPTVTDAGPALVAVIDAGAAPVAATDVATPRDADRREYVACGCGCCGFSEPMETRCLYHARGDDIERIIAQDRRARSSRICATAGCSLGVRYRYCD